MLKTLFPWRAQRNRAQPARCGHRAVPAQKGPRRPVRAACSSRFRKWVTACGSKVLHPGPTDQGPPDAPAASRARSTKLRSLHDIDYALCMYCGICVEVCPFRCVVLEPGAAVLRAPSPVSPTNLLGRWMRRPCPTSDVRSRLAVGQEGSTR